MKQPMHTTKRQANGFTLIELLVVITIVGLLASALGVTIVNMGESAREAQTIATLNKIDRAAAGDRACPEISDIPTARARASPSN